jgi:hypothetical protein
MDTPMDAVQLVKEVTWYSRTPEDLAALDDAALAGAVLADQYGEICQIDCCRLDRADSLYLHPGEASGLGASLSFGVAPLR